MALKSGEREYSVLFSLSSGDSCTLACSPSQPFALIKSRIWSKKNFPPGDKALFLFQLDNGQIFFDDNEAFHRLLQFLPIFKENENEQISCRLVHRERLNDRVERDLKTASLHGVIHHSGALSHKGLLSWKSRYYVAQEQTLFVYDSFECFRDRKAALEFLPLGSCIAERPEAPTERGRQFTFELKSLKSQGWSRVSLTADSEGDLQQWLAAINRLALRRLKSIAVCVGEELESRGFLVEGLFRVPGNKVDIETTKTAYDSEYFPNLHAIRDDHTLAGLLKLCLRQMPSPLLTFDHYSDFVGISDFDVPQRTVRLKAVILQLPLENQGFLQYLMCFLHKVSRWSERNLMTPRNLAIVFAPNILRPRVETVQSIMQDSQASLCCLESMIEKAPELWPPSEFSPTAQKNNKVGAATHIVMGNFTSSAGQEKTEKIVEGPVQPPSVVAPVEPSQVITRAASQSVSPGSLCLPDLLGMQARAASLIAVCESGVQSRRVKLLDSFKDLLSLASGIEAIELPVSRERELVVRRSLEVIQSDVNKVLKQFDQITQCIEGEPPVQFFPSKPRRSPLIFVCLFFFRYEQNS